MSHIRIAIKKSFIVSKRQRLIIYKYANSSKRRRKNTKLKMEARRHGKPRKEWAAIRNRTLVTIFHPPLRPHFSPSRFFYFIPQSGKKFHAYMCAYEGMSYMSSLITRTTHVFQNTIYLWYLYSSQTGEITCQFLKNYILEKTAGNLSSSTA